MDTGVCSISDEFLFISIFGMGSHVLRLHLDIFLSAIIGNKELDHLLCYLDDLFFG